MVNYPLKTEKEKNDFFFYKIHRKQVIQMPRPKKDGRYLNLYLDRTLHEEFEQFCESLGQTKTVAAERAFRMYMDAMEQNPKQIIRESKSPLNKRN